MKKELILRSENETLSLGHRIASAFSEGGFIALYGELGTGKSVLARGIAEQLGIDHISSPTFTILQRYDTDPAFIHIDAYRLTCADELYDIGYEDCLREKAIIAVEWADIVTEALPERRLDIRISGSGSEERRTVLELSDGVLSEEQFLLL